MKTPILYFRFTIIICLFFGLNHSSYAVMKPNAKADKTEQVSFTPEQIKQKPAQKFRFKEKIGLFFVKKRFKKATTPSKDKKPVDGLAVAGFIGSIGSPFISPSVLGILFSIVVIIFCAIAMRKIQRSEGKTKGAGLATAGGIIGAIALLIRLISR